MKITTTIWNFAIKQSNEFKFKITQMNNEWILRTGYWDNSGKWDNAQNWKNG